MNPSEEDYYQITLDNASQSRDNFFNILRGIEFRPQLQEIEKLEKELI